MLRQALNRTLQLSKNAVFTRPINKSCVGHIRNSSSYTEPEAERDERISENLEVTLCGQIYHVFHGDSAINVTLNTSVPDTKYFDAHKILIPRMKADRHRYADRINTLAAGDRLYLTGRIVYSDFVTNDSKRRQEAHVFPFHFAVLNDTAADDQNVVHEVNNVKLVGKVIAAPRQTDDTTFLNVSTQYFDPRENGLKLKIHSVAITDESLRKVASTMSVGSWAIINGRIKTRLLPDNNNRKKTTVSIVAQNLFERRID